MSSKRLPGDTRVADLAHAKLLKDQRSKDPCRDQAPWSNRACGVADLLRLCDERALMHLLGRPLLVYRALADLCGSLTASILLSRLLMEERIALRTQFTKSGKSAAGWYQYDRQRMLAATGLTRAEFYHARALLRTAGFVVEQRTGLPPRSEWRLDLEALASALEGGLRKHDSAHDGLIHRSADAAQQGFDFAAVPLNQPETRVVDQLAGIRTSRMWQNPIQECGNPTYR